MENPKFEFRPVNAANGNWVDLERLFESRGAPHYCWCAVWRRFDKQLSPILKESKNLSMKKRVEDGIPVGILVYAPTGTSRMVCNCSKRILQASIWRRSKGKGMVYYMLFC